MLGDAPVAVVLPAADLARATAFYIDKLGIKVMQEVAESTLLGPGTGTMVFTYQYGPACHESWAGSRARAGVCQARWGSTGFACPV
jgi:catechol 2,3-dioxygenase-like lactoylglutathione lyase family enzyme